MHALLTILAVGTSTTAKSSGKSSGSTYTLLFIVVIFAAVYLLFIRPRQQKMRRQQSTARQLSVGDEIVSAGGIYGRVVAIDTDVAEVEVAPGVVMTFLRRAVNPRPDAAPTSPAAPTADDEWPLDHEGRADASDEESPDDAPEQRS
jgi:preprotein translocase subunit YajC